MTSILVPYHLDEQLDHSDWPVAADQVVMTELPPGDTWARMSHLYDQVADVVAGAVRQGGRPVVSSGDCTTSLATVAGLQRAGVDPSIIWFDAHGDVQTIETSASGYLGGMPLRMLAGYGRPYVADRIGLRDVAEERVLLVDARDLDPPEADYLHRSAIRHCQVGDVTASMLPPGPLYLHMDFDVADPDDLPGLLFPAPGGPSLGAVANAVREIVATGRVAAFGAACTWHPGSGAAGRARQVVDALAP